MLQNNKHLDTADICKGRRIVSQKPIFHVSRPWLNFVFFSPHSFFSLPLFFKRMINTATRSHTSRLNGIFWLQVADYDHNDRYELGCRPFHQ